MLERRLSAGDLRLPEAFAELESAVIAADAELVNINRPGDLETIRQLTQG